MNGLSTAMEIDSLHRQKEEKDKKELIAKIKKIDSLVGSLTCEIKDLKQKLDIREQAAQPMNTITPGPELNQAVAEAAAPYCSVGMCASSGCIDIPTSECGDTAATDPDVLAVWMWKGKRNWQTLPKFSTDLNAAFEAAEKWAVGLFDDDGRDAMLGKTTDGEWEVLWSTDDEDSVQAPTPALAICAAILKRRESGNL